MRALLIATVAAISLTAPVRAEDSYLVRLSECITNPPGGSTEVCMIRLKAREQAKAVIAKCDYETKLAGRPDLKRQCIDTRVR